MKKVNAPYLDAKNITSKSLDWLRTNHDKDFFLWIHYMDAHRPYYPPIKFIKKVCDHKINDTDKIWMKEIINEVNIEKNYSVITPRVMNLTENLYNAEIRYIDFYIGVLIKYLKKIGIFDKTSFIITADHGEALFEHNLLGHQANLYDELLKIPLLMKLSEINEEVHIYEQVELMDLPATILELFQIPNDTGFKGLSLKSLIENKIHHPEFAYSFLLHNKDIKINFLNKNNYQFFLMLSIRSLNWKYIKDQQTNSAKLFNLMEDPKELNNLINSKDTEIRKVKRRFLKEVNEKLNLKENKEKKFITDTIKKIKFKRI
ncbi:MAG: sulfatase-like hydrolase/transferase [Candidatus Lokiarchaeota archaeon]|nr:sulfatase-like hydrolase/transferase [Candidatus Lokiarchaeota archaeon]